MPNHNNTKTLQEYIATDKEHSRNDECILISIQALAERLTDLTGKEVTIRIIPSVKRLDLSIGTEHMICQSFINIQWYFIGLIDYNKKIKGKEAK